MGKGGRKKPKPKPSPNPPQKRARKRKRQTKQNSAPPQLRPPKRKKRGPPSYAEGKVLFRKAGYGAQLTYAVEKKLSGETHAKRRQGYNIMWRYAPKKCEQLGFKKPGTFSKDNGHNGECWGWKKECSMSDQKAGKILLHLVNLETLTLSQLEVVRKSLAYSYQLRGNEVTKYKTNWPEVRKVWKAVSDKSCAPTRSTKPKRIPTPEELKAAFTQHWDAKKNQMSFLEWIIARRAAYDTLFCGHRPNKDMEKMKVTRRHHIDAREGWSWTDFKDGRSKLVGPKKNSREWKQFAVCWCKDGKHRSPTLRDRHNLDEFGNPRNGDPGFDDLCITAGFEFTNLWQKKGRWRRYPTLCGTGRGKSTKGNVGNRDVGEPIKLALRWMEDQGLGSFDSNSGRKALARMLSLLNIPYEVFEMHGDIYGNWEKSYQNGCRRERQRFERRKQSTEIDVATKALRKMSQWMGLGSKKPTAQLSTLERQNHLMLCALGLSSQADAILLGLNANLPEDYQRPGAVKPERIERVKPEPEA